MKSLKKVLSIAGIAAAFALIPMVADAQPNDAHDESKTCDHKKKRKGHKGKAFKEALEKANLDEATSAKVKGVFDAYKAQIKALHEDEKAAHESEDILQIHAARLKVGEKKLEMMTDVRAQLSDAQWSEVNANLKAMHDKRRHKNRHR